MTLTRIYDFFQKVCEVDEAKVRKRTPRARVDELLVL